VILKVKSFLKEHKRDMSITSRITLGGTMTFFGSSKGDIDIIGNLGGH
jgi:hypothetical protein